MLCLDVLYHRETGDARTLAELARVLRRRDLDHSRTRHPWLAGDNDALDHAARRFTRGGLCALLAEGGFTVRRSGYFNTLLFPLVAAGRLLQHLAGILRPNRKPAAEFGELPPLLNSLFKRIFLLEQGRVLNGGFPFGVSVLAVAEK